MMSVANMLLMMSVYMLIPALPPHLSQQGFTGWQVGAMMGVYGLGVFAFGSFCSFFVQRYRRNHVCLCSILGVVSCLALLYYLDVVLGWRLSMLAFLGLRFLLGAFLGLAQMTLCSTLIIDTCESFQRTEANHSAAWFSRFSLSLAPLFSLVISQSVGYGYVLVVSGICAIASFFIIYCVSFPFKAPDDSTPLFSLDRFFLPQGFWLFLNLVLVMTVVGLLMSLPQGELFYGMMMVGFLLALLSEKYVFADADLESEIVTGLILMASAIFILFTNHLRAIALVVPTLVGLAVGIMGSRFLLFFIKLSKHCQRGTSQSTFFLAWEFGMSLGLFLGIGGLASDKESVLFACLVLTAISLALYHFHVHSWYMRHRNR